MLSHSLPINGRALETFTKPKQKTRVKQKINNDFLKFVNKFVLFMIFIDSVGAYSMNGFSAYSFPLRIRRLKSQKKKTVIPSVLRK